MEEIMELKQCSRCHSKCILEHFEKNRKGEWFKTCNNCRKVNRDSFKNYREEHKEQELQRNRQYRANNIEIVREIKKQYHQEHRETIIQTQR